MIDTFKQHRPNTSDRKRRSRERSLFTVLPALFLFSSIPGCISPMHARLPVPWASHPQSERQAFGLQDPFPDPDLGPGMEIRPPDFARPRTETRRAAEQRLLQGIPSGPEYSPPGDPRGGLRRPNAAY